MSFIDLEFVGIQTLDIIAGSVDNTQILSSLDGKLDRPNGLMCARV